MSVPATTAEPADLRDLRDDGHLSGALGRLLAGGVPPLLPALTGALVTVVLVVAGLSQLDQPTGTTLFAPVAALLLAGAAAEHPHDGRFDWIVPPVLRGTEYLYLLALGLGSEVAEPLVFLLLATVAMSHCDAACRVRGAGHSRWVAGAMLGWDGRMLLIALGGAVGWLPFTYGLLAGYLLGLYGWAAAKRWSAIPVRAAREEGPDS